MTRTSGRCADRSAAKLRNFRGPSRACDCDRALKLLIVVLTISERGQPAHGPLKVQAPPEEHVQAAAKPMAGRPCSFALQGFKLDQCVPRQVFVWEIFPGSVYDTSLWLSGQPA